MPINLETAVESYLRHKNLAHGTRREYDATLRKWMQWCRNEPLVELDRKSVREFLDWVYERAVAEDGTNPGRTANKARENLRAVMSRAWGQDMIESLPRSP